MRNRETNLPVFAAAPCRTGGILFACQQMAGRFLNVARPVMIIPPARLVGFQPVDWSRRISPNRSLRLMSVCCLASPLEFHWGVVPPKCRALLLPKFFPLRFSINLPSGTGVFDHKSPPFGECNCLKNDNPADSCSVYHQHPGFSSGFPPIVTAKEIFSR